MEHGHISDFPWSKFLKWRKEDSSAIFEDTAVNIFVKQDCCNNPKIKISSNTGNSSGFDGKWLKCTSCKKGISLKGIMGVKIKCPGHKPWEATTGDIQYHSGDSNVRKKEPPTETCKCIKPMKVSLTTGNNIYYSRILSSIFLHSELFESENAIEIMRLEVEKKKAVTEENYDLAKKINEEIKELAANQPADDKGNISD